MKKTTLLNILLLSCISLEAGATNNEDPEDNFHKRKINNIQEMEDKVAKRFKIKNRNDNEVEKDWFESINLSDLQKELKERLIDDGKAIHTIVLGKFYTACLQNNDKKFEDMLCEFIGDFTRSAKFKEKNQKLIKVLSQVICLKNVCTSDEFKIVIKDLSLFYHEPEGWNLTSETSKLNLTEVLDYILFHKGVETEINIDEVKKKLSEEDNDILPDFIYNNLNNNPNNNLLPNVNKIELEPIEKITSPNLSPSVPEFKNTKDIRNWFGIKENETVPINILDEAKKYSSRLEENLLPEHFHIRVSYPKKQQIVDIDNGPPFTDINKWNYVDKFTRFYISLTEEAAKLNFENLLNDEELRLVTNNIFDQQNVLMGRHYILLVTKNMIMQDKFTSYIFSNNTASIHIENGYLDSKNIFQGYVQRDGTPDFDGVQIEERLNMYDHIYFQTYNLASELGKNSVVSFFKEFTRAQCLDARIYPIQKLLYSLQERKTIQENINKDNNQLDKQVVLNDKFMEYYSSNPEDTKEGIISKMVEFFSDKKVQSEVLSQNEIIEFVDNKFTEVGI